jgi:hypothetical protein
VNYLRQNESDSLVVLKFLKQLPQSMLRSYQKELKGLDKKDKTAHIMMLEDLTDSFLT